MNLTAFAASALSALAILPAQTGREAEIADHLAVVQLQLKTEDKETAASAVLVHREDGPQGVVLYFLTSESLIRQGSIAPLPWISGSECEMGEQSPPTIAVLRILTENSPLVPARVTFDSPEPGDLFYIVSHDATGARVIVPQHIGMVAERVAAGDVEMPAAACVGAPAFSEKGVFGIVSECEPNRPPLITLLSAARDLVLRMVPSLDVRGAGRAKDRTPEPDLVHHRPDTLRSETT